jgi:hypothetical protein
MPPGGATMVALESAAELPGDGGGQRKTQWAVPSLPRAGPEPATSAARCSSETGEGNHYRFFSIIVATGPAAMNDSPTSHDRRSSVSVPRHAGVPWNASGSASGAGAGAHCGDEKGAGAEQQISPTY